MGEDPTMTVPSLSSTRTAPVYRLTVPGQPRGQGSLTLWRSTDGSERARHPSTTVAYRNLLVGRAVEALDDRAPLDGAVALVVQVGMPRPRRHYRTGRFANELRPDAPRFHAQPTDLDKVLRLILDGLTIAGWWHDDGQVAAIRAEQRWTEGPGSLTVEAWTVEVQ